MKDHSQEARTAPDVPLHADICDLLVAELQGRRERLRQLLRLVAIEVELHSRVRRPCKTRPKCNRAAAA